jgi:hypothetical protein
MTNDKIKKALYNIDKWMPEDFELQREYYQLINDKDQKGMEEFLDMYADQDRLMRYGIQYEDLGKLSEAIISGSNYAKGGSTSNMKNKLNLKLLPYYSIAENINSVENLQIYDEDAFAFYNANDRCNVTINYNDASKSVIMYQEWDNGNMDDDEVSLLTFENYLSNTKMGDGGYMDDDEVIEEKIFDINDDEVSEDIYEFLVDYAPDDFELSEEDQYAIRLEDPERVIDFMNDAFTDYEILTEYDDDQIRLKIIKKMKMAKGGTTKKSDPPQTATEFFEWYSRGYAEWYNDPTILMFMKINGKEIPSSVQNSYPRNQKLKDILAFFKSNKNTPLKNYKEELDDYDYYTISFDLKDKKITMEENGNKFRRGFGRYGKNLAYSENYAGGGYMEDGGDTDEPDAEMEKLVSEHNKEAKRNRVKITNFGWSQGDDYIVSKTTERKDGSDVLTSEISNGVVEHDWDSYARGGKLKSNAAKFSDKVKAISKKLAGTKVPKKYKKDYGATYDKKEANTAAKRIAGAKLAEVRAKLAKKKK